MTYNVRHNDKLFMYEVCEKHSPPGSLSLVVGRPAQNIHHLSERLEEQLAVPREELDAVQNNLFFPTQGKNKGACLCGAQCGAHRVNASSLRTYVLCACDKRILCLNGTLKTHVVVCENGDTTQKDRGYGLRSLSHFCLSLNDTPLHRLLCLSKLCVE